MIIFSHRTALRVYFSNPALGALPRVRLETKKRVTKKEIDPLREEIALPICADVVVGKASLRGWATPSLSYHAVPEACKEDSFVTLGEYGLASPELCFLQMASQLDLIDLVLLGFRLCGDYRPSELRFRTGDLPLTSPKALSKYVEDHPGCKGVKRARQALRYVLAGSNSTMESRLTIALIFPPRWGGYGFSFPELNAAIAGTERKGDLCWLDKRLVVEYDSRLHHETSFAQERDSVRRAELGFCGFGVITVTRAQVEDPLLFDTVASCIARALGERTRSKSHSCLPCRKQLKYRLFHCFNEEELFVGETK